jgi:integrase
MAESMAQRRRTKGSGSLRLRGSIWWITYYVAGKPFAESSGSADKEVAANLLKQRLGKLAAGEDVAPKKVTVSHLCELVLDDYRLRKMRDLKTSEWRYKAHVKPALGSLQAAKFGSKQIGPYVNMRRTEGAEDSTINRELSLIRRGFKLGNRESLVGKIPYIPKLEEDNARTGFLEADQYMRLLDELPERLKALFVCAYHVGNRKGELRKIQDHQVDFEARKIYFRASQTKGKERRAVPIYGDMEYWLRRQLERRPERCPWVFFYRRQPVGAHLEGWREACDRAGLPGLYFHDLRRSAVRNMTRAGVPRSIAMEVVGHKTESMFLRYDIVSDGDLDIVGEKMEEYLKEERARRAMLKRVK